MLSYSFDYSILKLLFLPVLAVLLISRKRHIMNKKNVCNHDSNVIFCNLYVQRLHVYID